jgi:hypothetical protein
VGRVAFRADERLQKRLDDAVEAMKKSQVLKHVDVTPSLVLRAALGYGLPFIELEFRSKTFGDGEETIEGWLETVLAAAARLQDKFQDDRLEELIRKDSDGRSEKKPEPDE